MTDPAISPVDDSQDPLFPGFVPADREGGRLGSNAGVPGGTVAPRDHQMVANPIVGSARCGRAKQSPAADA